jgi:hypothetical protein
MVYARLGMLISIEFFLHRERCGISSNARLRKGPDPQRRAVALCYGAKVARQVWMTGRDRGIPSFGYFTSGTPASRGYCVPFALWVLFLPQNRPSQPSASIKSIVGPRSTFSARA